MDAEVTATAREADSAARAALRNAAAAWFVVAFVGQWLFAWHIAKVYVGTAFAGDFGAWNAHLFVGFVPGDLVGNIALAAHLFIAFVITIGGTLQLVPWLRTRAPAFHRWNGRLYITIAFVTSVAALYMIWTRDTFGGILINDISVSLDAVLIMVFAAIALRHARARRIEVHRRWGLRTFIVVSGVWFTRVFYGVVGVIPGDLPGVADDMSGRPILRSASPAICCRSPCWNSIFSRFAARAGGASS